VALYFNVRIGVRGDAPHPTLAGARVPKKPTISFQFFAASPRPPSAFERSGKEIVCFFGFAISIVYHTIVVYYTNRYTVRNE